MAVISISSELGSEGSSIAKQAAQILGYSLADKNVIGSILSLYGFVEFRSAYYSAPGFWSHFLSRSEDRRETMVTMLNRTLLALAHQGNMVIVGRGSFAVLGGFADVLNVRIQAPLSLRIERVMAQQKITDLDRAEAVVRESDKAQTAFVEWYYGTHWDRGSRAFDLVIDTGKIAPYMATTWLVEAAKALNESTVDGERATDTIRVDPVLASAVASEFKCQITRPGEGRR